MNYKVYSLFSVFFLVLGFVFLFNSISSITGYSVAENVNSGTSTIFSIYFFAGAIWFSYLANKQKKGQAAMEFLMTYGWAILAAIVSIGALAYFGVFTSDSFATGPTVVSSPFYVNAWNVQKGIEPDGAVNLELVNNAGEDYNIYSVNVTKCGVLTPGTPERMGPEKPKNFQVLCGAESNLVVGKTFRGEITINYRRLGSSLDMFSKGSIADEIVD